MSTSDKDDALEKKIEKMTARVESFRKLSGGVDILSLSSEQRDNLDKFLAGDAEALEYIRNLDDSDNLKRVYYRHQADIANLKLNIFLCRESEEYSSAPNIFTQAITAITGGNNVKKGVGYQVCPIYEGNISVFKPLLTDYIKTWGKPNNDTSMSLIKTAVRYQSKPVLLELMDADILTPGLTQTIEFRVAGKRYSSGEYETQKVNVVDTLLKSRSSSVCDALVEHPLGADFLTTAKEESVYAVFDYFFDTYKHDTLKGLLEKGLNPNIMEPGTGRALISNLAYKACDDDIALLTEMIKHGLNIRVRDEMGTTPIMQAVKQGLLALSKFLLVQPNVDLYMDNRFGDTVLTFAAEGPNRFEERYQEYILRKQSCEEYYNEKLEDWKIAVAKARATGEEEPPQPQKPQLREPVKDYPMELISMIQDAWDAGDPSTSDKFLLAKKRDDDSELKLAKELVNDSFDFGLNF